MAPQDTDVVWCPAPRPPRRQGGAGDATGRQAGGRDTAATQMGTRWPDASRPAGAPCPAARGGSAGDGASSLLPRRLGGPWAPRGAAKVWGGPKSPHVGVGPCPVPAVTRVLWARPAFHCRGAPLDSSRPARVAGVVPLVSHTGTPWRCLSLARSRALPLSCPALTHLGCNCPAHQPPTPVGPRGAFPLRAPSLASPGPSQAPPTPAPRAPPARPAPADTSGKSPPVTASWQALAEGFRGPQPAPTGHLLPEPRGGSLRLHPLHADPRTPSNSASHAPKHAGPAPSSSSAHLTPCQHPALSGVGHSSAPGVFGVLSGCHWQLPEHPPTLGTHQPVTGSRAGAGGSEGWAQRGAGACSACRQP